jgi:hypothetical protein
MNVRFGSKADISACPTDVRFTPESGHWSAPSSAILALQVLILAQDRAKPANKIIQKGLASARRQSGTVSSSECWLRFRDPAPPASSPRWGFGGGGDSRRTTEGGPDAQDKVQVQNRITPKRQQDQDP